MIDLIKDKVGVQRMEWLRVKTPYLEDLKKDEERLAKMKKEKAHPAAIAALNASLNARVEFFNKAEAYVKALHLEAVIANGEKMIAEMAVRNFKKDFEDYTGTEIPLDFMIRYLKSNPKPIVKDAH